MNSPERFGEYGSMSWTPGGEAVMVVKKKQTPGDPYGNRGSKELLLVPATGGKARKLDIDIDAWGKSQSFRLHPDGGQIAFFKGERLREIWALENLLPSETASK